ncbi:MAG: MFS transporter, partial [Burkholderiaceae bacterium]
ATRNALAVPFAGAYAALVGVALLALALISLIHFPPLPLPSIARPGRALLEIARQPAFLVAVMACSLGYGVMNLLMAATPIAMSQCAHPFSSTALVLEWHVLGMYVPSFFTGSLIRRFGGLPVMGVGVVLNAVCIAVALSGVDLTHFLVALFTLGVGWNFLYIGGTTLLTETYHPEEKTTAQAAMDTTVFTTMTITSFSSGALVTTQGWTWLNLGSIIPVLMCAAGLAWLAMQRRGARNQPAV